MSTDKSLPVTPTVETGGEVHSQSTTTPFPQLPPAPASHRVGAGWSSHFPIPTVQGYKETKVEHEKQAEEYSSIVAKRQAEAEAKEKATTGPGLQGGVDPSSSLPQTAAENSGKPLQEEEGNVVKKNQEMKSDRANANQGANEKAKMMDQMNSNQSKSF